MAIAKIKKIELIGLKENEESILVLLQRLALVQLSSDPGRETGTAPLPGADVN
jgi:hypothetical protein